MTSDIANRLSASLMLGLAAATAFGQQGSQAPTMPVIVLGFLVGAGVNFALKYLKQGGQN
jgi:hypothetical protein